jgi:hypothetical protein
MCMGLTTLEPVERCACAGGASSVEIFPSRPWGWSVKLSRVGTLPLDDAGEVFCALAAFGQPHSNLRLGADAEEFVYSGSDVYA